jgi:hypothetical protein
MKNLIYILVVLSFYACRYIGCPAPPDSFLNNQTGHDLTIIIHLDTTISNRYWPRFPWWNLHYFADDSTCFKVSIDTVNLIGTYRLKDGKDVSIGGGWAKKAGSSLYDYLEIRTFKDTIIFNSSTAIEDKLVQRSGSADMYYDLIVK